MPIDVLAGLDDEQRAAAEALHGPVVILAGAGTGKTRAITHRIAHRVIRDEREASTGLAVTFTTRAAGEMRTRLRALEVSGVQVQTFHAAALRQLRHFWPRINGGPFPELMPSKARLTAEAASRCGLPTNAAAVRDLAAYLEFCKSSDQEQAPIAAKTTAVASSLDVAPPELDRFRTTYEEIKWDRWQIDFEDVLLLTIGAIDDRPDIADEVRKRYRWFTVDEYQDVNPLQQRLLGLWLGERDDLCVVGDANQTIYSFTGATPDYLTSFRTRFPDATEVRLVRCYRCTPQIVDLANKVIGAAPKQPTSLVLRSQRDPAPAPQITAYDDDVDEAASVARRAKEYLDSGVPAREIAVLFRVNAQSAELEEAFAEAGVPVILRGTERFFDRAEVREAVTRLRGAARAGAGGSLADEVAAVLSAMGWSPAAPTTTGAVRERWESLAALATLAEELAPGLDESLPAFVQALDARAELQHAPVADGVTLASIHSAKGLEWPVVFVVGCSEGLLPLLHAESDEQVEEERRLAYVAITRAADRLHLSWARSRQPGGRPSRSLSRFVEEALGPDRRGPGADAGYVRRGKGAGRARGERRQKSPAKCRVCRKSLVTGRERTLGRCESCPADLNVDLLDALRAWRLETSRELQVPAYVVFTDVTLLAIAEQLPSDDESLAAIPGIGPRKLAEYGEIVLDLVREFC